MFVWVNIITWKISLDSDLRDILQTICKNYVDFDKNRSTNYVFNLFSNHFATNFIRKISKELPQDISDKYCGIVNKGILQTAVEIIIQIFIKIGQRIMCLMHFQTILNRFHREHHFTKEMWQNLSDK